MATTRAQLDLIAERLAGGMTPAEVAGWIARVTDRTPEQAAAILAAAETLQRGGQAAADLYTAADAAAAAAAMSSETR